MDTEHAKQKLEEEKKLLEGELGGLGRKDKITGEWEAVPEAQTAPEADENDLADRAENFEERSSLVVTLETRLSDITQALDAIEDGTYGVCKSCGKKIEDDRLEANPAAATCKDCMEKVI
jgi:RNA polymerase-binding transcription factor DksA